MAKKQPTPKPAEKPVRKVINVNPREEGWEVKNRGAERATRVIPTKQEAVGIATRLGNKTPNSQVVIRKKDGTIQEERTYGNDPDGSPG